MGYEILWRCAGRFLDTAGGRLDEQTGVQINRQTERKYELTEEPVTETDE
jgi:hypothetical protein